MTKLTTVSTVRNLPSKLAKSSEGIRQVYASRTGGSFERFVLCQDEWGRLILSAEKRDGTGELRTEPLSLVQADAFALTPIRLRGKAFQNLMA